MSLKNTSLKIPIVIGLIALALVVGIFLPINDLQDNENKDIEEQDPPAKEDAQNSEPSLPPPSQTKSQTSNQSQDYEILGKEIPAGYSFGNLLNNGLLSGMALIEIENSDQKVDIRFTGLYDGVLKEITLDILPGNNREIKIGIQEDDGTGKPNGKWSENFFTTTFTDIGRFDLIEFEQGINLEKGKVYHIIIEPYQNEEPLDSISISTFRDNYPGRPFNMEDPDIYSEDPFFNTLHYDGSEWEVVDMWPIFLLKYEDGRTDGQPYSLAAPWTIRGKVHVGQTLIPASDYLVSKIGIVVGKNGDPPASLYYGIKDSQNNILSEGYFADAENMKSYMNWVELNLDDPILFSAGNLYRIFLYSPIPPDGDSYEIYGDELSLDNQIGYGGERHTLTISHDGGESWAAWKDADVIFTITTG